MGTKMPEVGRSASLNAIRDYLQDDCFMLQVWGGKTEELENFQVYLSEDLRYFGVIRSAADEDTYTVAIAGDVTYVHTKNLLKLQKIVEKHKRDDR